MKPKVEIGVGDKVLAKVKGYPPWPATVDDIVGKRYFVTFYGTKETSKLKVEDLSDFIENKDKLRVKYSKKKELIDAIDELENELGLLKNEMSVENTKVVKIVPSQNSQQELISQNSQDTDAANKTQNETPAKRKRRSISSPSVEELPKPKRAALSRKSSINSNKSLGSRSKADSADNKSLESTNSSHDLTNADATLVAGNTDTQVIESTDLERDYDIVFADELYDKLLETSKLKRSNIPASKELNGNSETQRHLLMARLPEGGTFVGIRCDEVKSNSKKFSSDSDIAQHNDNVFRNALNIKNHIESGELSIDKIREDPEVVIDPKLTTKERLATIENSVVKRKQARLHWLQLESKLVEYDSEIKSYLGLEKAECEKALMCLDNIMNLPIEPLMLTKHPHVVEMVRRLRRYIGNTKVWNLTPNELEVFKRDAEAIQKKADELYQKFKKLYKLEGRQFTDVYNESVKEFNEKTRKMKEGARFAVCAEPGTKQFYIDQTDNQLESEVLRLKALLENKRVENKSDGDTTIVEV